MSELKRYNALKRSLSKDGKLMHVSRLLERAAQKWPNEDAIVCNDNTITYKTLFLNAIEFAKRLKESGVQKNDEVIIFYENSIEFFIAYFAIWLTGAIVAPLNIFLTKPELLKIIHDAAPKVLIISPKLLEKLEQTDIELLPTIISDLIVNKFADNIDITNLEIPEKDIGETVALLYTSGTTGFPKAIMLSSHNILINTLQGISRFETTHDEKLYCAMPLFHSYPQSICVWLNVVIGSTAIIVPKIDRHSLMNGLKYKPSVIIAVPALYGLFCKMKNIDFGQIKFFICGGDALTDKIRAYFELLYHRKICNGYGMTEASPFISIDLDDYTKPTSNVGKPLVDIECQIRDDKNNPLALGQIGALWVKGPNIMQGYYNAPETTQNILKDGWLNTGDLAYIDQNGKIVISGREKDVIKVKGINVYPQEVENILLVHPKIFQAAVIGIPNPDEGELPIAFLASIEKDHDKLVKELLDLCNRNLASYKIPKKFIIKTELPISATGKVDKKKLKAEIT